MAASADACDEVRLNAARRQAALYYHSGLPAPAYYQFSGERGLVLSRCAVDPNGERGSFLSHQLLFDEPCDVEALFAARPIAASAFREVYVELEDEVERLPTLKAESLRSDEALSEGFSALDRAFEGRDEELAGFLHALCEAVVNRGHLPVVWRGSPKRTSESARAFMELVTRCVLLSIGRRISYCTLLVNAEEAGQYSVSFRTSPPESGDWFDFDAPALARRPFEAWDLELARAMLAHDLNWVDRLRGGPMPLPLRAAAVRMPLPPFEAGMSLRQYLFDWMSELELRREALTAEAFKPFAAGEWRRLTGQVVSASILVGDSRKFVWSLTSMLALLRRDESARALCMPRDVLFDWIQLAADSLCFDELDLTDPATVRLTRVVCAYAAKLESAEESMRARMCAYRLLGRLLEERTDDFDSQIRAMSELGELDRAQYAVLQALFHRYVDAVLADRPASWTPDDRFTRFALLSRVRFEQGVPDFRGANEVAALLGERFGERAQRAFERRRKGIRSRTLKAAGRNVIHRISENAILSLLSALLIGCIVWLCLLNGR